MLQKLKNQIPEFSHQFWTLFWGMLIISSGISLIWPFLTIYMRETLDVSLTTIASLVTLSSLMTLLASLAAGPISDQSGRKWIMVVSIILNAVTLFFMSYAHTFIAFAVLMAVRGLSAPLYQMGADAMIADIVAADRRMEAYSLIRMSNNVGVALGPMLGGFIIAQSYQLGFNLASAILILYGFAAVFLLTETLPKNISTNKKKIFQEKENGYGPVVKDKPFMVFCGSFTLTRMTSALVFVLLAVYLKENFAISESHYGFLMATNALMVVFLQYSVSRFSKRYSSLNLMTVGSIIYGISVGSIAFGTTFFHFMLSIILMTLGELITAPTASNIVALFSPANMRGRYMSVYWLTINISRGIAPVVGGFLNDRIAPQAIWYGGLVLGLMGAVGFLGLNQYSKTSGFENKLPEENQNLGS